MNFFKKLYGQVAALAVAGLVAAASFAPVGVATVAVAPVAVPAVTSVASVALPTAVFALTAMASTPAHATLSYATTVRSAHMTDVVTASDNSGAHGAIMKGFNGCTKPAGVGSTAGCTTLFTLSWPSTAIGTVTSGVLTINTSPTQTNSAHVAGTPTFIDITDSGGTVVLRMDVCGTAPCWTFPNPVVNGQNVTISGMTLTAGNP